MVNYETRWLAVSFHICMFGCDHQKMLPDFFSAYIQSIIYKRKIYMNFFKVMFCFFSSKVKGL